MEHNSTVINISDDISITVALLIAADSLVKIVTEKCKIISLRFIYRSNASDN